VKQALENSLANVIAMGAKQFSDSQGKALVTFRDKARVINPENKIVKIIDHLDSVLLLLRKIEEAPKEVKGRLRMYGSISTLSSLRESQKLSIGSQVTDKVLNTPIAAPLIDYTDLLQFVQILIIFWEESFIKINHKKLYEKLLCLKEKASVSTQSEAKSFCETSLVIIKKMEKDSIPEDIKNCNGYHGKAIDEGLSILLKQLKDKGITNSLIDPVSDYCKDHLNPFGYILRNSTSQISYTNEQKGIYYFTFTISFIGSLDQDIAHRRITRREKNGEILWYLNPNITPDVLEKEIEDNKILSFNNLNALIQQLLPGYQPVKAITSIEASIYYTKKYSADINF
jgi:hypothetical protein